MSNNLTLYNAVRVVPPEAIKPIIGGRLKGMSDISPMWRIKVLTEQFGMCGMGWKYEVTNQRLEAGGDGQIAVFVDINLYYKQGENWSEPVPGAGGSMFVTKESKGLYTDDDCFKKALTDAIGVACKALGIGADVYWQKDKTKYSTDQNGNSTIYDTTPAEEIEITADDMPASFKQAEEMFKPDDAKKPASFITDNQQKRLFALAGYKEDKEMAKEIVQKLLDDRELKSTKEIKKSEYEEICQEAEVMLAKMAVGV